MIFDFIKKCNFDADSVIFEIGAHMGFDSEKIFANTQNSKMYCFEPDPRNIKVLKERKIDSIATIVEVAISDKNNDMETFFLSEGNPNLKGNPYLENDQWSASNSLRPSKIHDVLWNWCSIKKKTNVKTITLDSFCLDNNIKEISFIWMDVQGCEDLVFAGGKQILKTTKYLYTEYSNVELYEGQKNLDYILEMLPGKWKILQKFGNPMGCADILLENEEFA